MLVQQGIEGAVALIKQADSSAREAGWGWGNLRADDQLVRQLYDQYGGLPARLGQLEVEKQHVLARSNEGDVRSTRLSDGYSTGTTPRDRRETERLADVDRRINAIMPKGPDVQLLRRFCPALYHRILSITSHE